MVVFINWRFEIIEIKEISKPWLEFTTKNYYHQYPKDHLRNGHHLLKWYSLPFHPMEITLQNQVTVEYRPQRYLYPNFSPCQVFAKQNNRDATRQYSNATRLPKRQMLYDLVFMKMKHEDYKNIGGKTYRTLILTGTDDSYFVFIKWTYVRKLHNLKCFFFLHTDIVVLFSELSKTADVVFVR